MTSWSFGETAVVPAVPGFAGVILVWISKVEVLSYNSVNGFFQLQIVIFSSSRPGLHVPEKPVIKPTAHADISVTGYAFSVSSRKIFYCPSIIF